MMFSFFLLSSPSLSHSHYDYDRSHAVKMAERSERKMDLATRIQQVQSNSHQANVQYESVQRQIGRMKTLDANEWQWDSTKTEAVNNFVQQQSEQTISKRADVIDAVKELRQYTAPMQMYHALCMGFAAIQQHNGQLAQGFAFRRFGRGVIKRQRYCP